MGIDIIWDCEALQDTEGYYQIQSGIEYAVARSLAVAPFADLLWMETKTANLADARRFAEAIHAEFPSKMLAYNLSPSFNWDTTGMSEAEMRRFPEELGKLGFVFNFITYGGHQIDGLAAEEFAAALNQDGMLSLARLQRKFRLVESPTGRPRRSWAGRGWMRRSWPLRAARRPPRRWARARRSTSTWSRPRCRSSCSRMARDVDEATRSRARCESDCGRTRRARSCWSSPCPRQRGKGRQRHLRRDRGSPGAQHPLGPGPEHLRQRPAPEAPDDAEPPVPVHRYKIWSVHYVSPTDDNRYQAQKMKTHGLFSDVHDEVGDVIVAE
jgi:Isocitrate lyase